MLQREILRLTNGESRELMEFEAPLSQKLFSEERSCMLLLRIGIQIHCCQIREFRDLER